ncbi:MAG: cation:proton antiporter [bacterium]|nr:cation:proton antiporter [bacterium]
MLALAAGGFLAIRSLGSALAAPARPAAAATSAAAAPSDVLPHVLLALLVVIAAARALGAVFRRLHQPPVIGEVLAGILLGPSLLGRVWPEGAAFLLPPEVAPYLNVLAQVGIVLFMFLVGLELDTTMLGRQTHATVAISHASIVAPFLLGAGLALWLYPQLATADVPFTSFALFLGVAMSVTAFPVLARILTDRGLQRTKLGVVAITCAAVDDVSAWCLLALVVAIAQAQAASALVTLALTLAYVAAMFLVVRPLAPRLVARLEGTRVQQGALAGACLALLASALVTELIGIHAVFGAFFLGAVIPHDSQLARDLTNRLEDLVVVLLLPAFFAFTGMRTEIGLVHGLGQWAICAVVIAVACAGKFGGSAIAARLAGLDWRDAASLGVLMNTRGLMELVVLNIGLDLGVISPTLFAMLVMMAIVTTVATSPLLHLLQRDMQLRAAPDAAVTRPRPRLR